MSNTGNQPPGGTPPASKPGDDDPPPSSQSGADSPDSKPLDSEPCAEIPTAAHAVLEAEIKLLVRIPRSVDEVKGMPHKLTLTSDGGTLSVTVSASEAEAGDIEGTSVVTFTGLAEHHSYTLSIDNGSDASYQVFAGEAYERIGEEDGSDDAPASAPAASRPQTSDGDDASGAGAES